MCSGPHCFAKRCVSELKAAGQLERMGWIQSGNLSVGGLGFKKGPHYHRKPGPIEVETTFLHTSLESGLADRVRIAAAFKSLSQGHGTLNGLSGCQMQLQLSAPSIPGARPGMWTGTPSPTRRPERRPAAESGACCEVGLGSMWRLRLRPTQLAREACQHLYM